VRLRLALVLAAIAAFVPAAVARPQAEPTGPRLLVARSGGLVVLDSANGTLVRVPIAGDAVWSADGTLLAFARTGELWLANADGSGVRRLTRTQNVVESAPSWGGARTLAYTATTGGARQVRMLRLPSGKTRRIAAGSGEDWSAAFSADGKRLAFVSTRLGTPAVFVAPADGTEAELFHPTVQEGETPPSDVLPRSAARPHAWGARPLLALAPRERGLRPARDELRQRRRVAAGEDLVAGRAAGRAARLEAACLREGALLGDGGRRAPHAILERGQRRDHHDHSTGEHDERLRGDGERDRF
jgi:hypothetical protein